jgi:hypothetical protein
MQSFSSYLKPEEQNNFETYRDTILINQMRQEIETVILTGNINENFDLVIFNDKFNVKNMKKTLAFCNQLQKELNDLGWKTKLAFGETALYVFTSEKKPVTWG